MPYLVCDEPSSLENITYYTILGLGPEPIRVNADPDTQYGFKYDISNLAGGKYSVRIVACNEKECSIESAPFDFTVLAKPTQPKGLRLI